MATTTAVSERGTPYCAREDRERVAPTPPDSAATMPRASPAGPGTRPQSSRSTHALSLTARPQCDREQAVRSAVAKAAPLHQPCAHHGATTWPPSSTDFPYSLFRQQSSRTSTITARPGTAGHRLRPLTTTRPATPRASPAHTPAALGGRLRPEDHAVGQRSASSPSSANGLPGYGAIP